MLNLKNKESHWIKFSEDLRSYTDNIIDYTLNLRPSIEGYKINYNNCNIIVTSNTFYYFDCYRNCGIYFEEDNKMINITKYIPKINKIYKHLDSLYNIRKKIKTITKETLDKQYVEEKLFGIKNAT